MSITTNKLISLLSPYIPFGLASSAIKKSNPKLGNFITNAVSSGFAANEIMDYLRNKIGHPERQNLEKNENNLRPDEKASLENLRQGEAPIKAAQSLGALSAGAGSALSAYNQIAQNPQVAQSDQNQTFVKSSPNTTPTPQAPQDPSNPPTPSKPTTLSKNDGLEKALEILHKSAIGQFIRSSFEKGNDLNSVISSIIRKEPDKILNLEKLSGNRFEDIIQAYLDRIGKNKSTTTNNPNANDKNSSMDKLMSTLQAVVESRQRRK